MRRVGTYNVEGPIIVIFKHIDPDDYADGDDNADGDDEEEKCRMPFGRAGWVGWASLEISPSYLQCTATRKALNHGEDDDDNADEDDEASSTSSAFSSSSSSSPSPP